MNEVGPSPACVLVALVGSGVGTLPCSRKVVPVVLGLSLMLPESRVW